MKRPHSSANVDTGLHNASIRPKPINHLDSLTLNGSARNAELFFALQQCRDTEQLHHCLQQYFQSHGIVAFFSCTLSPQNNSNTNVDISEYFGLVAQDFVDTCLQESQQSEKLSLIDQNNLSINSVCTIGSIQAQPLLACFTSSQADLNCYFCVVGQSAEHLNRELCRQAQAVHQTAVAVNNKLQNLNSAQTATHLLKEVVTSSSEFIFVQWDGGTREVVCDGFWRQHSMASPKEPFGHREFFDPETWTALQDRLKANLSIGKSFSCEYKILGADGETKWLRSKVEVLSLSPSHTASSYLVLTRDISELKRDEGRINLHAEIEQWLLNKISILFGQHDHDAVLETFVELNEFLNVDRIFARTFEQSAMGELYAEWTRDGITPISQYAPNLIPIKRSRFVDEHLSRGEGVFIHDIATADNVDREFIDYQIRIGSQASMILPAMYRNKITGILVAHSCAPRVWTELEKRIMSIVANVIGVVISQDYTIKKLTDSENRFETAMSAAGHGFWEVNFPKNEIFLSSTCLSLLGYPPVTHTVPFNVYNHFLHPDDSPTLEKLIDQILRGEITEYIQELREFRKDGSVAWILSRAKVMKWDENHKPVVLIGTDVDISKHKQLSLDLQLARQEADAANKAKSEFLARMSHEIRTPMNAIIGLNYLLQQTHLSTEQGDQSKDIEQAAKSLLSTINDILDFSKIEAGKMVIDNHVFEVQQLANRLQAVFAEQNRASGIVFNTIVGDKVPKYLIVDSARLTQVSEYLLSNAIKFTSQGSIEIAIDFIEGDLLEGNASDDTSRDDISRGSASRENSSRESTSYESTSFEIKGGSELHVCIRDTGIGMDAYTASTLFDAFNQADVSSTREHGGTGLGLTITQRLIAMMGGDIRVETAIGKGSTFSFFVKCQPVDDTLLSSAQTLSLTNTKKVIRVLLAEDNIVNQKVAAGILKKRGAEVVIANNGREALYLSKAVDPHYFDAILMDIEMPGMNGYEAALAIRALTNHRNTPIIAMTAHSVKDEKQNFLRAGMSDAIEKPIDPDKLYECLLRVTQSQTENNASKI